MQLNSNNRRQNKKCVHGIQGIWYWARLQYADLETQFTWPLVHHAISGVVVKGLKLIINDHYHKGKGSKIVNHKISELRAPKEKNRQRMRGVAEETKANGDGSVEANNENKEDDNENEEGGPFSINPFSIEKKRKPYVKRKAPNQVFSNLNTDCVQEWLDCVLLPPGLSDDWKVSLLSPLRMKISQEELRMILCY